MGVDPPKYPLPRLPNSQPRSQLENPARHAGPVPTRHCTITILLFIYWHFYRLQKINDIIIIINNGPDRELLAYENGEC